MSVIIRGKQFLDANNYSKIIIRQSTDRYYVVVHPSKDKYPSLETDCKLSDSFKRNSVDKILTIVDSFLRNTTISEVSDGKKISIYDGKFSVVKGIRRELNLRLFNEKLRIIPKKVMDKYQLDRLKFCESNSDINYYEMLLGDDTTSYERINKFGEYVRFTLLHKNEKLAGFEKEFLKEFILEKLYNIDEEAKVGNKIVISNQITPSISPYLTCGELKIRLGHQIIADVASEVVDEYNKKREETKKMQLKLDFGGDKKWKN